MPTRQTVTKRFIQTQPETIIQQTDTVLFFLTPAAKGTLPMEHQRWLQILTAGTTLQSDMRRLTPTFRVITTQPTEAPRLI